MKLKLDKWDILILLVVVTVGLLLFVPLLTIVHLAMALPRAVSDICQALAKEIEKQYGASP